MEQQLVCDNEIGGSGAVDEPNSSRYYYNCCNDSCDGVDSDGDDGGVIVS